MAANAEARTVSVGPARIVCNAAFCEMGSSARPKERVRVIVSDLPRAEIYRLRKCTGVAKPCIVTIEGAEYPLAERRLSRGPASPSEPAPPGTATGSLQINEHGPMRVMASSISWQD